MGFYSKFSDVMIKVILVIGGVALMVMTVIVVGNSLGRALFRMPILGTIEIAGLAGVFLVSGAIGFTERERRNIVVDTVAGRFTPRTRACADAVTLFLSLAAVAFLLYAVIHNALYAVAIKEATLTTGTPTAPFKFTWAIGIIILCLFLFQHVIEAIKKGGKQ